MAVNLIAAVGKRGQLGLGNKLPWRDPDDMAWFLATTRYQFVVLGPKTAKDMPKSFWNQRTVYVHQYLDEPCLSVLDRVKQMENDPEIFIAGGAGLYHAWLNSGLVQRCHIGMIDYDGPADVYMPSLWSR